MDGSAEGLAALALWESITLLLVERGLLKPDDILETIEASIEMHNAAALLDPTSLHAGAAALLRKMVCGTNIQSAVKSGPSGMRKARGAPP